jgi:transposase
MKRLVLERKSEVIDQIQGYLEGNAEAKFIHRLQVILMFAGKDEESCDSLGSLFRNSPRSISNWIKRVNQTGSIESLRSKVQPGRISRLTQAQKDEIRRAIEEQPEKRGKHGNRWNGKNLSLYISQRYGISLNHRSCQRLFREIVPGSGVTSDGVSVKKPGKKVAR